MTIISFILVVDTNFSALNMVQRTVNVCEYNIVSVVSVMTDYVKCSDSENTKNCAEHTSNQHSEEENNGYEEEVISFVPECFLAGIVHTKLNINEACNFMHMAPHIEFLTPPPEI